MIEGQLSHEERAFLTKCITDAPKHPAVALEVGTWLGGGSTLHILRALEQNGVGQLWGIEASPEIYARMKANLAEAAPELMPRFTPLLGTSEELIPNWLKELGGKPVDFAFLDGGDNPEEQIAEFHLLDPHMPVGATLLAHDANMRKGKWLVPYLRELDHWTSEVRNLSEVGLLVATKTAESPSAESRSRAERVLEKARSQVSEAFARFLPASVRQLVARVMPRRLLDRIMAKRG